MSKRTAWRWALSAIVATATLWSQVPGKPGAKAATVHEKAAAVSPGSPGYILGARDEISVFVLEGEELNKNYTLDESGEISMPMIGRIAAAGLTVEQLEKEIATKLRVYFRDPQVSVSVLNYQSEPVSVLGAVGSPGVYQLRGERTLMEIVTAAGGLKSDAAPYAKVTREKAQGRIPLPTAVDDPSGYSMAEINLKAVMNSEDAAENIVLKPNDVITVRSAASVYVIGQVVRPGNFPAIDREPLTVLQAIALAGGIAPQASPGKARILRMVDNGPKRQEVPVNVSRLMNGKATDVALRPNDILIIPDSAGKKYGTRMVDLLLNSSSILLTYGIVH